MTKTAGTFVYTGDGGEEVERKSSDRRPLGVADRTQRTGKCPRCRDRIVYAAGTHRAAGNDLWGAGAFRHQSCGGRVRYGRRARIHSDACRLSSAGRGGTAASLYGGGRGDGGSALDMRRAAAHIEKAGLCTAFGVCVNARERVAHERHGGMADGVADGGGKPCGGGICLFLLRSLRVHDTKRRAPRHDHVGADGGHIARRDRADGADAV